MNHDHDNAVQRAHDMGRACGEVYAGMIATSAWDAPDDDIAAMLAAWDDGDTPFDPSPLSGEWADADTFQNVIPYCCAAADWATDDLAYGIVEDCCTAYEDGYYSAFDDILRPRLNYILSLTEAGRTPENY